jgi:cell division protein WhiA
MSFSDDLRNELATIAPASDCDRLAELSGLFHAAGSEHLLGRGTTSFHLDVVSSAVARRAFSLLRALGVGSEIRTYRQRAFSAATRFQLHVPGDRHALAVLRRAGVVGGRSRPLERPPRRVVARACCRSAYLRGTLLGAGSLTGPRAPHLEIRAASAAGADFVAEVAGRLGAPLKVVERGRHAAAYARGTERIADVLAAAGAADAVLLLEERAVMGATRARANRLANADHANLVRTSRAAHAQLEAVRLLELEGVLPTLPPPLREVAELRLRHPALPLRELALECHPPCSKASVHRRLLTLRRLAERRPGRGVSYLQVL